MTEATWQLAQELTIERPTFGAWTMVNTPTTVPLSDRRPVRFARRKVRASSTPDVEMDRSDWVVRTVARLIHVAALRHNWDAEGSPGTLPGVVNSALVLLARLQEVLQASLPEPFVCPVPGGGLQLEWTSARRHLELEFMDEARIGFLTEERAAGQRTVDSGDYEVANVERTSSLLEWFAGESYPERFLEAAG